MNTNSSRKVEWLVWGGLAVIIAGIVGAFAWSKIRAADGSGGKPLPVYGTIPDFILTDQNGGVVTRDDLAGKVVIADIIFTRCAGPCPEMTRKMGELQAALPAAAPVRLVTLTTDPDFDTPEVLKSYAERFGAQTGRWLFLTGEKKEIYRLAVEGLKLSAVEVKPEERASPVDLFIHSTMFVIVDKEGRLRGVFETTGEGVDWRRMKPEIIGAARSLLREK